MRKNLYVISGPSGVGKDTIVRELLRKYPLNKTVSVTTRPKRNTEVDGVDYYFISRDDFETHLTNGDFVESVLYAGELYGTLFSEIERHPKDKPLILVIEVSGRRNVMRRYPLAKSIFILPPSIDALRQRITDRNQNSPEEIERRLEITKQEMNEASKYTYQVVNDSVDACVESIYKIIAENRDEL